MSQNTQLRPQPKSSRKACENALGAELMLNVVAAPFGKYSLGWATSMLLTSQKLDTACQCAAYNVDENSYRIQLELDILRVATEPILAQELTGRVMIEGETAPEAIQKQGSFKAVRQLYAESRTQTQESIKAAVRKIKLMAHTSGFDSPAVDAWMALRAAC